MQGRRENVHDSKFEHRISYVRILIHGFFLWSKIREWIYLYDTKSEHLNTNYYKTITIFYCYKNLQQ